MIMFHVEPNRKTLFRKGFLLFLVFLAVSCIKPQHTIEIQDYVLLENGKQVLGKEKGLTAFIFENNPTKIPFHQFVADKYAVGSYTDVKYDVKVDGYRFKVLVYENAEMEKYFNMSQFMVTNSPSETNIVGSTAKFIAISVINDTNEDCLDDNSLYKHVIINYLKNLKDEFNNL